MQSGSQFGKSFASYRLDLTTGSVAFVMRAQMCSFDAVRPMQSEGSMVQDGYGTTARPEGVILLVITIVEL